MTKKILGVLLSCYSILQAISSYSEEYDFRKVKWGMTKQQVFETEKNLELMKKIDEDSSEVRYGAEIEALGRTMALIYSFIDNKLVNVAYAYMGDQKDHKCYDKDYEDIKSSIIDQYGNPKDEKTSPNEIQLRLTCWESDATSIELELRKVRIADYTYCGANFKSKKYDHLLKRRDQEIEKSSAIKSRRLFFKILEKDAKEHCIKEWKDDFVMQKHCLDKQGEAISQFLKMVEEPPSDIPEEIRTKINKLCRENWPGDFEMVVFCCKKQMAAWKSLNR